MGLQRVGAPRVLSRDLASDFHASLSLPSCSRASMDALRLYAFAVLGMIKVFWVKQPKPNKDIGFDLLTTLCCLDAVCLHVLDASVFTLFWFEVEHVQLSMFVYSDYV